MPGLSEVFDCQIFLTSEVFHWDVDSYCQCQSNSCQFRFIRKHISTAYPGTQSRDVWHLRRCSWRVMTVLSSKKEPRASLPLFEEPLHNLLNGISFPSFISDIQGNQMAILQDSNWFSKWLLSYLTHRLATLLFCMQANLLASLLSKWDSSWAPILERCSRPWSTAWRRRRCPRWFRY